MLFFVLFEQLLSASCYRSNKLSGTRGCIKHKLAEQVAMLCAADGLTDDARRGRSSSKASEHKASRSKAVRTVAFT
eukprot:scaffold186430_cov37-Attheya_sp.AAC.2